TVTSSESLQPARYFIVNGMVMALRTWRSSFSTSGRSRSRPDPPLHFTTLLTGQPKLISRTSKPRSWQTRAASAMTTGSAPKSCAEMGCSSGSNARYFSVLVGLREWSEALTPWELVNSVMMSPHPPRFRMKRRKTVSVTPAMGARTVAGAMRTFPIVMEEGTGRVVAGDSPALGPELSQYLRTILFYLSAQKAKPPQKQRLKNPCQSAKIRDQALFLCRLPFRIFPAEA